MQKGFDSNVFDSQMVFRQLLTSMANPGVIQQTNIAMTPPDGVHPATGAILLTLMDYETPFWSDIETTSESIQWLSFHTGAPSTDSREKSVFALCTDCKKMLKPNSFNQGTLDSPQTSTTLIIQTDELSDGGNIKLTGPGIKNDRMIGIKGLNSDFLETRQKMNEHYPLGVDMIFVSSNRFVAIPRTSVLEIL